MEIEIVKHNQFTNKNGVILDNYKIFLKGKGLWLSSVDFEKSKDLLTVKDEIIILKEPIEKYYSISKRKNKNGEFSVLLPLTINTPSENVLNEPTATYATKKTEVLKDTSDKPLPTKKSGKAMSKFSILEQAGVKSYGSPVVEKIPSQSTPYQSTSGTQDKIAFIISLLDFSEKKKVDSKTRERLFKLIGKELENAGYVSKEILERLERVEGKIGTQQKETGNKSTEKDFNLNDHKPEDVTAFLSLFGSNDHPFKYLVHDYTIPNKVFALGDFCQKIKKAFKNETKKYSIPKYLHARLKSFIGFDNKDDVDNKKWFFKGKSNSFSFCSDKVKEWCSSNPNKHPIFGFEEDIKLFKESIKVEKNLEDLINYKLAEKQLLTDFDNPEYVNLAGATFYTDVDALLSGLGAVFNAIRQRKGNGNKLKITFEAKSTSKGRRKILKITHIRSRCKKKLSDPELLGGDLKDAKKFFYKLCDWSIVADNPDTECNKINILFNPSSGIHPKEKIDEKIEGFTHVLTFYS